MSRRGDRAAADPAAPRRRGGVVVVDAVLGRAPRSSPPARSTVVVLVSTTERWHGRESRRAATPRERRSLPSADAVGHRLVVGPLLQAVFRSMHMLVSRGECARTMPMSSAPISAEGSSSTPQTVIDAKNSATPSNRQRLGSGGDARTPRPGIRTGRRRGVVELESGSDLDVDAEALDACRRRCFAFGSTMRSGACGEQQKCSGSPVDVRATDDGCSGACPVDRDRGTT